jgi:hypothetical protein
MKRSLVALAILALGSGTALAAPGDPRVVQGVLEWPATLSAEPFVVVRGDDGRLYYTDIGAAQRRAGALTAGSRMAVLAVEGNRPWELAALAFGPGDAASLGLISPPPPPGAAPAPAAATPPTSGSAEAMWRLDGSVQSVADMQVTVRTSDGRTHTVDASQLSSTTIRALRPGDRVTLFGVPRSDDKLVANGYIQSEPASPAASPPSTR